MIDKYFDAILNGNKIDLTTKEGHDEFVNAIGALRDNNLFNMFGLSKYANKEIENAIAAADEIYNKSKQIAVEEEKKQLVQPSTKLSSEMKEQIKKLVAEYLDTMIKPNYDMTDDQYQKVFGSLLEFAAWIYTK